MAIHSNGLLTALNFIQQWEYSRDLQFLERVAFPFSRDALAFYQCWMTRVVVGDVEDPEDRRTAGGRKRSGVPPPAPRTAAVRWQNTMDQSHECSTPLPQTEENRRRLCYQNNSVLVGGCTPSSRFCSLPPPFSTVT